jgi:hypothetical protein
MKRIMGALGTATLLAGAVVAWSVPASATPAAPAPSAYPFAKVVPASQASPLAPKAVASDTTADLIAKSVLTLGAHSTLHAGHFLIAQGGAYALYLSPDGPLGLFAAYDDSPLWTVNVKGANPTLAVQSDGNIVLRDGSGKALWATGTTGVNASVAFGLVFSNGELSAIGKTGAVVWSTKTALVSRKDSVVAELQSSSLQYDLSMQQDGNLVIRHLSGGKATAIWSTGTNLPKVTTKPVVLVLQDNDNLVAYAGSKVLWNSKTTQASPGVPVLEMQSDGNLVLREITADGKLKVLWASGTAGKV